MNKDKSYKMAFPPSAADFALNTREAFECTMEEFDRAESSDARGMILDIFIKGMTVVEGAINDDAKRDEFLNTVRQGYNLMILKEVSRPDGLVDPGKLLLVTSREVLAGRMNEDDELRKLAVLGPTKKKKSLWKFWRN